MKNAVELNGEDGVEGLQSTVTGKVHLKRNPDYYTQVHISVPVRLNDQLNVFAARNGLTKGAWISQIITKVIENDGVVSEARLDTSKIESRLDVLDKNLDELSRKVDTLTNLVSAIIAQSSVK